MSDAVSPGRTTYELAKTADGMVATAVAPSAAAARRDLVGIGFLVWWDVGREVGTGRPLATERSVGTVDRVRQALPVAVTVSSQPSPLRVNRHRVGPSATLRSKAMRLPSLPRTSLPTTFLAASCGAGLGIVTFVLCAWLHAVGCHRRGRAARRGGAAHRAGMRRGFRALRRKHPPARRASADQPSAAARPGGRAIPIPSRCSRRASARRW